MIIASNWRPLERNTLRGFLTLSLEPSGIAVHECSYHQTATGSEWIGLPARPQLGKDGQARKDPTSGKALYRPIVEIKDKAARDRFQAAALDAVHRLLASPEGA
jgi:hypothetical protein